MLTAYLQEPSAKERGVSAVYLLSGFLTRNPTNENEENGHKEEQDNGMDLDGKEEPTTTQGNDKKEEEIKTRTVMLVSSEELEGESAEQPRFTPLVLMDFAQFPFVSIFLAKSSLFSPAPSSHIYALTPSALPRTEFSQLTTAYLPIANSSKWKPPPDKDAIGGGYGGITSADGKETKRKGKIVRKPTTTTAAANASASGSGSGSKVATKVEEKGKGKASTSSTTVKKEELSSSTTTKKGKKKVEEVPKKKAAPKIVPIGQRGGLFSKSFAAKKEESSDEEEEEEESEEEVKPKKGKTVPAKRKSNSPQVARKAPPAPVKKPSPKKAKGKEVIDLGDDDEDDWAMDEEAMAEMEREANAKVQAKKPVPPKKKPVVTKKKENETDSERQKRELEVSHSTPSSLPFSALLLTLDS